MGRALSLELSAVQQYMTHASLAETWADLDSAERFRRETVEELKHAELIVQRMLGLGVAPAASQLLAVSHGPDLLALLHRNAVLEDQLIEHYSQACRYCTLVGDTDNRAFFESLWQDERHHAQDLADWMASLGAHPLALASRATF
ncbi:MAG: ferritin-like domain-containing protein [Cyanobium sp.]